MEKRGGELKTKPKQKPKTLTPSSTSLNEGVLFMYSFILRNILFVWSSIGQWERELRLNEKHTKRL